MNNRYERVVQKYSKGYNEMKRFALAVSQALLLCSSSVLFCQVTPDTAQGITPYAEYVPGDIDNVNPVNGNLFLKIPLLSYPQRGGKLKLDYYIYYNDKQWQIGNLTVKPQAGVTTYTGNWQPGDPYSTAADSRMGAYVARDQYALMGTDSNNWTTTYPMSSGGYFDVTTTLNGYFVETPDGSKHYLGDSFVQSCYQVSATCPTFSSFVSEFYPATDASGWYPPLIGQSTNSGLSQVLDGNGIRYTGTVISDPNGNEITTSASGWTDTEGRTIQGSLSEPGVLSFPNSNGNQTLSLGTADLTPGIPSSVPSECPKGTTNARTWTVPASQSYGNGEATYYFCYTAVNYQTNFSLASVYPSTSFVYSISEASQSTGSLGQAQLLTAIVLPDGVSMYTFAYDSYLSLTQLGLPSGGTINYTWENLPFAPWTTTAPVSRALKTRTVLPQDSQPSQTWNYHWTLTPTSTGLQCPVYAIVTDPLGNDTEHLIATNCTLTSTGYLFHDLGTTYYAGCGPHDTSTDKVCAPATGTLMKTESYSTSVTSSGGAASGSPSYIPPGHLLANTTTTLTMPGSQGAIVSMVAESLAPAFDSCQVYTYPVTSPTQPENLPTLGGPAPSPTLAQQSNCFLTGQIASATNYDFGSPGSGTFGGTLSSTTTTYKWQSSPATYLASGLMNLASSRITYGAKQAWTAESYMCYDAYGNQTSTQRYPTQPTTSSCSTPPANAIISQTNYNSQGVVTSAIDPNGNTTSVTAFACDGSLPQSVTLPDGDKLAYTYDCNIGKVASVKNQNDLNNNTAGTVYTYNDSLGRVTSISYPDGGSSQVNYNSGSLPLNVTVTTATGEASGPSVTQTEYDGLARKIHTYVTDSISTGVTDTITSDTK